MDDRAQARARGEERARAMPRPPNILFIMSDDHAANAVGAYGSRLAGVCPTPNIDRIAREGVRLEGFFSTNSICTPARASLMTGQHGHTNGVRTLGDPLPPGRDTFVRHLRAAGYATALFGKWHLLTDPVDFDEYKFLDHPRRHRPAAQQGLYFDPYFLERDRGFVRYEGHVTDIITDMTVEHLRERDRDKPFFLMCHHKAPHDWFEYAPRFEHLFDGVEIPEPESLFEDRGHRSVASRDYGSSVGPRSRVRSLYHDFRRPDHPTGQLVVDDDASFADKTRAAYRKYLMDYLRCVAGIDESVGRVLGELEAQGILDETIVVYTSDQGMFLGEHDYQDKRWSFEESLRCPFLVRYPREIAPGTVNDDVISNVSVAPTLLDYAGGEPLARQLDGAQGRSFRRLLAGETPDDWPQEVYFRYWMHRAHKHDNPAHYGLRTRKWKLTFFYGLALDASGAVDEPTPAGWELYDVENDPLELHNLYADPALASVVRELKQQLDALKRRLGDTDRAYPEVLARRRELDG